MNKNTTTSALTISVFCCCFISQSSFSMDRHQTDEGATVLNLDLQIDPPNNRVVSLSELRGLDYWLISTTRAYKRKSLPPIPDLTPEELTTANDFCDFCVLYNYRNLILQTVFTHNAPTAKAFLSFIDHYRPQILTPLFNTHFPKAVQFDGYMLAAPLLHIAIFHDKGDHLMSLLFIAYGAPIKARDSMGLTPLHWAVKKKAKPLTELLKKYPEVVGMTDYYGHTALSYEMPQPAPQFGNLDHSTNEANLAPPHDVQDIQARSIVGSSGITSQPIR